MIIYSVSSGTRTIEMDLTSVSAWFKPYIGWVGDANGQTLTIESRASFDNGSTWTSYVTNSNNDELTDAFNETTESHADIVEIKYSLATSDNEVSPWIDQLFIYFPDFDPYLETFIPSLTVSIDCYLHAYMDQITLPLMALDITRDMSEYSYDGDIDCALSLDFVSNSGSALDFSLPKLDLSFKGTSGTVASLTTFFKYFDFSSFVGIKCDLDFLPLSFESNVTSNLIASFNSQFQPFQLNCILSGLPLADIEIVLPAMIVNFNLIQGNTTSLFSNFPEMYFIQKGLTGSLGDFETEFLSLSARIEVSHNSINDLLCSIPLNDFQLSYTESQTDNILTYNKGTIR